MDCQPPGQPWTTAALLQGASNLHQHHWDMAEKFSCNCRASQTHSRHWRWWKDRGAETPLFVHFETKGATQGSVSYLTVGSGEVGYLQKALGRIQWLSGLSPSKMTISCNCLSSASTITCNPSFPPGKSQRCVQGSSHSPAS